MSTVQTNSLQGCTALLKNSVTKYYCIYPQSACTYATVNYLKFYQNSSSKTYVPYRLGCSIHYRYIPRYIYFYIKIKYLILLYQKTSALDFTPKHLSTLSYIKYAGLSHAGNPSILIVYCLGMFNLKSHISNLVSNSRLSLLNIELK